MTALILNSGTGSRMGAATKDMPKCMTQLTLDETILSRQLLLLKQANISKVVITTGRFDKIIQEHCRATAPDLDYTFVQNPLYDRTNYIYSIYHARQYLEDDLVLMHGDLVFDNGLLQEMIGSRRSCMAVCTSQPLPDKDFKAVFPHPFEENGTEEPICRIGIDCFDNAVAAQPLYYLLQKDWKLWLEEISTFCKSGNVHCYAENAFNAISNKCLIYAHDIGNHICGEVDTPEDLNRMKERIKQR